MTSITEILKNNYNIIKNTEIKAILLNKSTISQKNIISEDLEKDNITQIDFVNKVFQSQGITGKLSFSEKEDDFKGIDFFIEENDIKIPFDFKAYSGFDPKWKNFTMYLRDFNKDIEEKGYIVFGKDKITNEIGGNLLIISPNEFKRVKVSGKKIIDSINQNFKENGFDFSVNSKYDLVKDTEIYKKMKEKWNGYSNNGITLSFADEKYERTGSNISLIENIFLKIKF